MHNLLKLPPNRRVRTPFLISSLLVLGLLLTACGVTDDRGTKFQIIMDSLDDPGGTFAGIGALMVDERATFRFEVTPSGEAARDRTSQAHFTLESRSVGDDPSAFVFFVSPNPSAVPHIIRSSQVDVSATLCATYDGPEVVTEEPQEVCMRVVTIVPEEA